MTAISWPLTGKNRRGRGRCVHGVWTETAKDEEIICKEKSVILSSIIFIIISLFLSVCSNFVIRDTSVL